MPLPNTRVIPAGWEAHHRPVAEGTFTALCAIDTAGTGPGEWNDETDQYDPPARVVLHTNVPCRVQQLSLPQVADAGQQRVSSRDYRVSIPITVTDAELDQHVTVTGGDATLDVSLIGRPLVVIDVQRGSLTWERDLTVIDNLG